MEKNEKKKNKRRIGIFAIALMLFLAVGITAGTTLAKYITSGKINSNQATIAKWGYTITATNNMFGDEYYANGTTVQASGDSIVVKSQSSGTNIVAPGTKGSVDFTVNGSNASEVDALLTIDLSKFNTFKTINLTNEDDVDYSPIVWTVGTTPVSITSTDDTWTKAFVTAFKTELAKIQYTPANGTKTALSVTEADGKIKIQLPAGSTLETTGIKLTIGWEWKFDNVTEGLQEENAHIYDTILGWLADENDIEEYEGYALDDFDGSELEIVFPEISITIEQVKSYS